jgi:hypothetical protein
LPADLEIVGDEFEKTTALGTTIIYNLRIPISSFVHHKGFFLIISNQMTTTSEDSLYFYPAIDCDEKLFDQIHIDIQGRRIRTHNNRTTEAKVFVTFIALAIRAYILSKLEKYIAANSSFLKHVFRMLENITVFKTNESCQFTKLSSKTMNLVNLQRL